MNKIISSIFICNILVFCAFGSDGDQKLVLDKMYNDILKSMPVSKRQIVESAVKLDKKNKDLTDGFNKSTANHSDSVFANSGSLPDELNRNLQRMMQQIDTMRQKRIIHFMTTDPPSK